jgi:hypothetical protein
MMMSRRFRGNPPDPSDSLAEVRPKRVADPQIFGSWGQDAVLNE